MAEQSLAGFVERWQTGAFVVFGSVFGGIVAAVILVRLVGPAIGVAGFFAGALAAFAAISYLFFR